MENLTNKTIGQIVAEDYRTAAVFESYGIDFCCNGNRSIEVACEAKKINKDEILDKLKQSVTEVHAGGSDYKLWPIDLLADYIEKKHHRYVEEKTPIIKQYLHKISQVHGKHHPELLEIEEHFNASAGELAMHMKKEELMLFPFVRKMMSAKSEDIKANPPHFGTVSNPVQAMMQEHDTEGERFRQISELSDGYNPPADACNTYRVAFSLLKEFEEDLHLHIHLENNILFPKAIALEKTLTA
ncbi:iron-sulfur cluster repair di-iron protein [Roseivirga echinicomitans]